MLNESCFWLTVVEASHSEVFESNVNIVVAFVIGFFRFQKKLFQIEIN